MIIFLVLHYIPAQPIKQLCDFFYCAITEIYVLCIIRIDLPVLNSGLGTFESKHEVYHSVAVDVSETGFGEVRPIIALLPNYENNIFIHECGHSLGSFNNFFFRSTSPDNVVFMVKPDCIEKVNVIKDEEDTGKCRLVCSVCPALNRSRVGRLFNNDMLIKKEKVKSIGVHDITNMKRWRDVVEHFPHFLVRKQLSQERKQTIIHPIIFPSSKVHFLVDDLVLKEQDIFIIKTPRKYQIEAFREALLRNSIIVIPTGKGKTFIASLVIHRFKKLNPNRLAIFIVPRIPLVFQQSSVITRDTLLRVEKCCSETTTTETKKNICNGFFDVLVITDGQLYKFLQEGFLRVSDFCVVVFDECHHAGCIWFFSTTLIVIYYIVILLLV